MNGSSLFQRIDSADLPMMLLLTEWKTYGGHSQVRGARVAPALVPLAMKSNFINCQSTYRLPVFCHGE